MKFEQLSAEYVDDYIAEAMLGREMEWFHYDVDRQNFAHIMEALPADDTAGRTEFAQRIRDTSRQMEMVERVYAALQQRIRDPVAHAAAIERVRAKRDAAG